MSFIFPSDIAFRSCAPLQESTSAYLRCYDEVYTYAQGLASGGSTPTAAPSRGLPAPSAAPALAVPAVLALEKVYVMNIDFPGTVTFFIDGKAYPVPKAGSIALPAPPIGAIVVNVPGKDILTVLPITNTVHSTRVTGNGAYLQSSRLTGKWTKYAVGTSAAQAPSHAPSHAPPSSHGIFVWNEDIPFPVTFHVDGKTYVANQGQKVQLPMSPKREIVATLALQGNLNVKLKLMPITTTKHAMHTVEHGFVLESSALPTATFYKASILNRYHRQLYQGQYLSFPAASMLAPTAPIGDSLFLSDSEYRRLEFKF